ncbi:MAG: hypothetical protein PHQ27_02065 [Victivallales bacterium]|nr:hypothetical protein [Victivallales bacterium]
MKKSDWWALAYAGGCAAAVIWFPFGMQDGKVVWGASGGNGINNFGAVTLAHPFIMGFLKFGLLATFGEMIKARGKTGSYRVDSLPARFLVWGLYGLMFSVVFPVFSLGVRGLVEKGLWFGSVAPDAGAGDKLLLAFSCSLFINMIFAYPMMLSHEWFNQVIAKRRLLGGEAFFGSLDKHVWGSFIPFSVVWFWIPAHTITFSLPGEYRILMAAVLSVALGFLLTFRPKK